MEPKPLCGQRRLKPRELPHIVCALRRSARARRAGTTLATSLALVTALAACSPSAAEPSPSPTVEPRFATDEEAYSAAVQLYDEYSVVSGEVANSGGAGSERLLDFADSDFANQLLREVEAMREKGLHMTGAGTHRAVGLESINELRSDLDVRMCLGAGDSRTIDADGNDVTPPEDSQESPVLVSFVVLASQRVLISGSNLWTGENFC